MARGLVMNCACVFLCLVLGVQCVSGDSGDGQYGGVYGSDGMYGQDRAAGAYGGSETVRDQSFAETPTQASPDKAGCVQCVEVYEQCAGGPLEESVCCTEDTVCTKKNEWYAQCLPEARAARNVDHGWDGSTIECGTAGAVKPGDQSRTRSPRDAPRGAQSMPAMNN